MPEKLLSIKEVAECLKISEEEVKRLVDIGEIPAYKIGGTFLRFRKEQIDVIRTEVSSFESKESEQAKLLSGSAAVPSRTPTAIRRDTKKQEAAAEAYDYTFFEKVKDFFYFNDFYVLSIVIIVILLWLIFKS